MRRRATPSGRGSARPRPETQPTARWERRLRRQGFRSVAGLDEVGRGCWAGPLVAGAVILPAASPGLLAGLRGLRDSKQLSPSARERLSLAVRSMAVSVGLGVVDAPTVDLIGLGAAGSLAMLRAVRDLGACPDYLLVDAFMLPGIDCPQEAIVHGDALCLSIAAASVVAKVARDRMLDELAERYPGYGFERNRGYGTEEHIRALAERGVTPEHRLSYAPLQAFREPMLP